VALPSQSLLEAVNAALADSQDDTDAERSADDQKRKQAASADSQKRLRDRLMNELHRSGLENTVFGQGVAKAASGNLSRSMERSEEESLRHQERNSSQSLQSKAVALAESLRAQPRLGAAMVGLAAVVSAAALGMLAVSLAQARQPRTGASESLLPAVAPLSAV